jgi:arginine decarboxylase
VYPIKVNQQRQVVEEVLNFGKPYRFGLEAGSKPELLAVVALADNDTPIICNGLQGRRVHRDGDAGPEDRPEHHPGHREVHRAEPDSRDGREGRREPQIGMRVKLATRGSGRWQSSGGLSLEVRLTVTEIMRGLEELKSRGMQDCLKLLHFHLGSQITNIRIVKGA